MKNKLMPIKEAARMLGYKERSYFCHSRERDTLLPKLGIRYQKIGGRVMVCREDVEALLKVKGRRCQSSRKSRSSSNVVTL